MGETREALLSFESKHGLCAESILQGPRSRAIRQPALVLYLDLQSTTPVGEAGRGGVLSQL